MRFFRGFWLGSLGVLGLQLLLVACGDTTKNAPSPGTSAADAGSPGNSSSAGKTSGGGQANAGGNSAGGSSAGPGNASDLDSFLVSEGVGFCARLFRCFEGNDDFSSERLVLKSEQGCKELLARVNASSGDLRDLRAQIAAGNVHYDP